MPGGKVTETTRVRATVTAVDTTKRKVGEKVVIRVREAFAVKMDKP